MRYLAILLLLSSGLRAQSISISEPFDEVDPESRGWYDNTALTIDSSVKHAGAASVKFHFAKGATTANGGIRHPTPESDAVYLSYWVRYSENWTGSNKPYHPHEFHFLTNLNDKWRGPAFSHLTLYIEQNEGHPMLGIQDGENIDQSQIKVDLTDVTENRAVAGCNGNADGYDDDCYLNGTSYVNGKTWRSPVQYFADDVGPRYKAQWHHVEAYFKLNSIKDGKGVRDGIVRYWYDGETVIDHDDVLLRTGQYPEMRFNQFLIAPYIGDGSPVDQTMWVDDLLVSDARPISRVFDDKASTEALAIDDEQIHFSLEQPSEVTLIALDLLGRSIELYHGSFPEGDVSIPYRSTELAPGCYNFLLVDNQRTLGRTKVMVRR